MTKREDPRKPGRLQMALTGILGLVAGLFVAIFMFIQLRAAWNNGVVLVGPSGPNAWDLEYDVEPLSYIVAMSALYPAAIVCGVGLAAASLVLIARSRGNARRDD
jgi:TRAP-type C4-dicarboxylate transport system permease small subunit